MLSKIHRSLSERFSWYRNYHDLADYKKAHWTVLFLVIAIAGASVYDIGFNKNIEFELNTSFGKNESSSSQYGKVSQSTNELLRRIKVYQLTPTKDAESKVKNVVAQRRALLSEAAKTDPSSVLAVAIDSKTLKKFPQNITKDLEQEASLEGTISISHRDDFQNKIGYYDYKLKTATGKVYNLFFASAEKGGYVKDIASELSSKPVKIKGVLIGSDVVVPVDGYSVYGQVKGEVLLPNPEGEVKAAIVKKMSVIVSSSNYNKGYVEEVFAQVKQYYEAASYNKWSVTVDVFGPYPYNPALCSDINVLYDLARPSGFMPENYDIKVSVNDCGINNGASGHASITHLSFYVAAHEVGHAVGLMEHANSLTCTDPVTGSPITISYDNSACFSSEYGDVFSVMGTGVGHHHAYDKNLLKYFDPANVLHVYTSGTYTISTLEEPSLGPIIIAVDSGPLTVGRWGFIFYPTVYYLEYRKDAGVIFHKNNSLLDSTPADRSFNNAALTEGNIFDDGKFIIKTISQDATTATVEVKVNSDSCVRTLPAVSVSPSTQWAESGQSATYSVSVTNKDTTSCGNSAFTISPALPAGFTQTPAMFSESVAAGATITRTFTISTQQGTAEGVYQFTQTAVNTAYSQYRFSSTANLNLTTPPVVTPPPPAPDPTPTPILIPHIELQPSSLSFNGVSFGSTPTGKTVTIQNTGSADLNWSGSTSHPWCQITPTSGLIKPGANMGVSITVSSPTNVGSFDCTVSVAEPMADNTPQVINLNYTVTDGTLPVTSITSPVNGATVSGVVQVNVQASDNVGVNKSELFINDNLVKTSTSYPYSYSLDTTQLVNGTFPIYSKAYDAAGNVGQSATLSITVSNVIPASHIEINPVSMNFAGISGGPVPTVQTAVMSNTGNAVMTWTARSDQNWCRTSIASGNLNAGASINLPISVDAPSNPGSYTCLITISGQNADNNTQAITVTYTVGSVPADTTAPVVSIVSPLSNATIAKKSNLRLTANASDNKAVTKVEFYVNNSLVCSDTTGSYSCVWKVPASPNKTYTLQAKAYDAAGNIGVSGSVKVLAK